MYRKIRLIQAAARVLAQEVNPDNAEELAQIIFDDPTMTQGIKQDRADTLREAAKYIKTHTTPDGLVEFDTNHDTGKSRNDTADEFLCWLADHLETP